MWGKETSPPFTPTLGLRCSKISCDAGGGTKRIYARFSGISSTFEDVLGGVIGGQGWIRTSVRKTGQIYSLLPLTTRPPVHFLRGVARGKGPVPKKKRPIGETALACQCLKWERAGMNRNFSSLTGPLNVIA